MNFEPHLSVSNLLETILGVCFGTWMVGDGSRRRIAWNSGPVFSLKGATIAGIMTGIVHMAQNDTFAPSPCTPGRGRRDWRHPNPRP